MLWHAVTWCWRCWNMEEWLNGTPGAPAPCHIHVNVQPSTSTENEWEWTWTSTLQTEPHCLSRTDRCHSNQSVSADLLRHSLCCSLLEILKDWRRRLILCEDLYWRASTWESYWQGVIDSLGAEDHPNTFRKHPKTQDSKSSNKATCLYPQKSDVFHLTWTLELLTAYSMFIHYVIMFIHYVHSYIFQAMLMIHWACPPRRSSRRGRGAFTYASNSELYAASGPGTVTVAEAVAHLRTQANHAPSW